MKCMYCTVGFIFVKLSSRFHIAPERHGCCDRPNEWCSVHDVMLYSSVPESHDTRAEVTEFAMIRGNNV